MFRKVSFTLLMVSLKFILYIGIFYVCLFIYILYFAPTQCLYTKACSFNICFIEECLCLVNTLIEFRFTLASIVVCLFANFFMSILSLSQNFLSQHFLIWYIIHSVRLVIFCKTLFDTYQFRYIKEIY